MATYRNVPVADPMGNKDTNPSEPQYPPNTQPIPGDWHDPMCPCVQCACKPK